MKTIYDLELHEELLLNDGHATSVVKVPGGWIYTKHLDGLNQVFVPFKERKLTAEENQKAAEEWAESIRFINNLKK